MLSDLTGLRHLMYATQKPKRSAGADSNSDYTAELEASGGGSRRNASQSPHADICADLELCEAQLRKIAPFDYVRVPSVCQRRTKGHYMLHSPGPHRSRRCSIGHLAAVLICLCMPHMPQVLYDEAVRRFDKQLARCVHGRRPSMLLTCVHVPVPCARAVPPSTPLGRPSGYPVAHALPILEWPSRQALLQAAV